MRLLAPGSLLAGLTALALVFGTAALAPSKTEAAAPGSWTFPVTNAPVTLAGVPAGTLTGAVTITDVVNVGGQIHAVGSITGAITPAGGGTPVPLPAAGVPFIVPVNLIPGA